MAQYGFIIPGNAADRISFKGALFQDGYPVMSRDAVTQAAAELMDRWAHCGVHAGCLKSTVLALWGALYIYMCV